MLEEGQGIIEPPHQLDVLADVISPLRMGTYVNAAGHDKDRALLLYIWNAKMGEAFHLPIQAVEVGLRNRVSAGISVVFGNDWWKSDDFLDVAAQKQHDDVQTVLSRLHSKGIKVETGQIVAGLSFGFWVAMLNSRYNVKIWSSQLHRAFPHLPPETDRQRLFSRVSEIADFRNRISHHEPIFKRNLSGDFQVCMLVLGWLCPTKQAWIKQSCTVSHMIRKKP